MKKYQIIVYDETTGRHEHVLTTTNKAEAEIVYDGYKETHAVALLESDMNF